MAMGRGIALGNLHPSIGPGEDFFEYVNHGWITSTPKPAGYEQYGESPMAAYVRPAYWRLKHSWRQCSGRRSSCATVA